MEIFDAGLWHVVYISQLALSGLKFRLSRWGSSESLR